MQDLWRETPCWAVPGISPIIGGNFIFVGYRCSVCKDPLRISPSGSGYGVIVEPCERCFPEGIPTTVRPKGLSEELHAVVHESVASETEGKE
jgi:hypothetical protein